MEKSRNIFLVFDDKSEIGPIPEHIWSFSQLWQGAVLDTSTNKIPIHDTKNAAMKLLLQFMEAIHDHNTTYLKPVSILNYQSIDGKSPKKFETDSMHRTKHLGIMLQGNPVLFYFLNAFVLNLNALFEIYQISEKLIIEPVRTILLHFLSNCLVGLSLPLMETKWKSEKTLEESLLQVEDRLKNFKDIMAQEKGKFKAVKIK